MVGLVSQEKPTFATVTKFKSLGLFTAWKLAPEDRIESKEGDAFYSMNMEDRQAYNKQYSEQTMYCRNIERNDPALVQTVEELGKRANGSHADLKVVEIPDGVEFQIEEYDGLEWVAEVHKTWS
jgi:hypothetical protein